MPYLHVLKYNHNERMLIGLHVDMNFMCIHSLLVYVNIVIKIKIEKKSSMRKTEYCIRTYTLAKL